jgi:1-acyl-sn-glycerol-3-phosphate acyltransferase
VRATVIFLLGALELIIKRPATREQRAEWLHKFCTRAMREVGIVMRVEGTFPERGVVISNHTSYLDVMTFAAFHRCVFVSKSEMADVPLLGWMTTMAGTVYVERGRGGSAQRAKGGMEAAAEAGLPIVIFPEGTTSNGTTVLKFHSGILGQVLEAGQEVTAAFVSYRLTEDNGPNATIENDVCYWGDDVSLFRHIYGMLGLRGIEVIMRIGEKPIAFTVDALHRKQAAIEARAAVMELGGIHDTVPAA